MIADDMVALAMGVMDGRDEVPDFEVAGVVAGVKEVLEDFKIWDWLSDDCPAKDEAVGDWRREEEVDS
jgi:hypothetical protein